MRRTSVLALALLCACACATATKPPAEKAAEQTAPAIDPFAGCVAGRTYGSGFLLQCGPRVAGLERDSQLTPERALDDYYAALRPAMEGELRRSPVERVVGGQLRHGLSLSQHVDGQPAAQWKGEILAWSDQDGATRLVFCGAASEADREPCGAIYEALATASGLPQGLTPPEPKQLAGWPPAIPPGCTAGPRGAGMDFHAICPASDARLMLMRLGDGADAELLAGAFDTLSAQTLESFKLRLSSDATMETVECIVAGTPSACSLYVFPQSDKKPTLAMLMGLFDVQGSAVAAQCYFTLKAGVPAECAPWVTVAE